MIAFGALRSQSGSGPSLHLVAPPTDTKTIGVRWRTTDLAPAATSGRICLTDPTHGRICAAYTIGEKPADALTRRITSLGLRVKSSG